MSRNSQLDTPTRGDSQEPVLVQTLQGHDDVILRVSWSPNGDVLASTAVDRTIRLWDWERKSGPRVLVGHDQGVNEVAWDPMGRWLASCSFDRTIRVWDLETGETVRELRAHTNDVSSISLAPAGDRLASASADKTIRIWRTDSWDEVKLLELHTDSVYRVVWSKRGDRLASCSKDGKIVVWDSRTLQPMWQFTHHGQRSRPSSVAWSSAGTMLCATSFDGTVQIWIDPTGGSERAIDLAHHSAIVRSATFSHDDRLLATSSMDGTVRVWRTDTWEPVARIAEPTTEFWPQGIAFHPSRPLLATFGDKDRVVRIWQLDIDALLGVTPMEEPVYRNAKVVLLGDTGVGKSGLRLVLTGEPYTPTESTYGRRVWPFDLEEHESGTRRETREILLWDMAGQPGYRLIHQLYLNEVAVALLVFDARQAAGDPLSAVRHWERALRQAQQRQGNQGVPLKRFLVLGRADIQGPPVARERIDGVMREWALDGFFVTSAKEGRGITELRHAIQTAVDWSVLPEVKSPELFTIVRDFVLTEKRAGRLLVPIDALYRSFSTSRSDAEDPEVRQVFETCISRLENRDLIRRLSFGTLVLLQPELLDAYASAIVQAAEAEELSASGSIPEADALEGRFGMPDSERVPNKQLEKLLLIATIEELLQHQLGLREPAQEGMYLIFPSQFTNVWAETDEPKGQTVSINFEGPVRNLYATVVVRLAHSGLFQADRNDMWKNAAIFAADTGGRCGVSLREFGDGSGQLRLFFQADASGRKTDPQTQHRFEAFVLSHLEKRAIAGSVKLTRRFVCPGCETVVPTAWADGLLARGQLTFRCPVDDVPIPLVEPLQQIEMLREDVGRMDSMADRQRDRRVSEMVVKGKEAIGQFDVFLCYNREDTTAVDTIYQRLLQHKVRPWLDTQNLRPGDVWLDEVEKLVASVKAAAIFVGASSAGPVQGMEIRALLRTFADRKVRIIPVLLPGAEGKPSWSTFLSDFQWVDFQKTTPEPLSQLVYGITGVHPQLQ